MSRLLIMKLFIVVFSITFLYGDYTLVGNPYKKYYPDGEASYARNIWDMQFYDGKIYIGAGNSSNKGPAQNAGRVYVISLDPKTDKFSEDYKVAEEQIDIFKVYKDVLYIPGHDATQKWTLGNIYTKKDNNWKKHRTLPNALHVYDLAVKDGKVLTAIGLKGKGAVFVSTDMEKWKEIPHGDGRVYSFLEVGNELFATRTFKLRQPNKLSITQWLSSRETFSARSDLNVYKMFPDTKLSKYSIKITKPLKLDKGAIYIGAYKHNDHQSWPFGLYYISNSLDVKSIDIPKGLQVFDTLKRGDKIYILANKKDKIEVFETNENNISFKNKIISFSYPTFARSFEEYNNCFYIGMGTEVENPRKWSLKDLSPYTGDILKVCK